MICFSEAGERDIASRNDHGDRSDRSDRSDTMPAPDTFARAIASPHAAYVREVSIEVTLYRSGTRAVLVPKETAFEHVPAYVRHWLGRIDQSQDTSINEHTPMIGVSAAAVIYDLLTHGFCVIEPADPA